MARDWDILKNEYIHGYLDEKGILKLPTLKELSERHKCSYTTLRHISSDNKWTPEKKLFRKERDAKIQEKKLDIIVDEVTEFDSEALKASKNGIKEVIKSLKKPDLSTNDHQKLSIALTNYQKVGLLALGEPTERVKNDNKHEMIIDEKFKDPDIRADLSSLYEQWDEKADKSSGLSED
jgi:hypothetical protein